MNSLSWGREVIRPQAIDPEGTIFSIDLRDYEWEIGTNRWTLMEEVYPYKIAFNALTQTGLHEKLTNLREEMDCEVPFVHVDWFIATASLPPLYHDILGLPQTDRELEARLEVNVVENIQNAAGRRVWRAGFNNSGVSNHNRVVERHISRYGAYWKSYDFAGSVGTQNILTHPLSFTHDGGEIIFNLPNGLQAYYLADAGGNRLDAAPISIVSNPAASDPTVRNGLSCIGCHTEGMKTFEDQVRPVVQQNTNPPYDKAQALRLYTEKVVMDELVSEDTQRYRQALEAAGDIFGGIEPVQRFHEAFQAPLDVPHAAASVGLETETFLAEIHENTSLQNLGLLVLESGTVKRDTWTFNFGEVVTALSLPDSPIVTPVVPQMERIPGASVHIPDANLRAVLTEALGKSPGDPITAEEMLTLERLRPIRRDIRDLTGLQFAANLEMFDMRSSSVSDLSPLAGLTKLKSLYFSHTPVSDLSPLAGLTNLENLEFFYAENPSLAPLKGLIDLKKLSAARSEISDISPLAGLINLESLALFDNNIQDISPLAALHNLKRLNLEGNDIQDISPLGTLRNLENLEIQRNDISDVSFLDGLPTETKILWYENPVFPPGGPKIEGPWLWVMLPGKTFKHNDEDMLAQVSGGTVTELEIATNGATEGTPIGDSVWTAHKLSLDEDNIHTLVDALGWGNVERSTREGRSGFIEGYNIYGSIRLYSQKEQQTNMFVGSDDGVRVRLNGELIHEVIGEKWRPTAVDYKAFFPVTLKAGANVLLVAVDNHWGHWTGFFGFDVDTEYTVMSPGVGFTFSSTTTNILIDDRFTVNLNAEKVTNLAGWQSDIAFDPTVLEAIEVNEGDFLKTGGGTTFFQKGGINNRLGKITGLSAARISAGGVKGSGTLLSITFIARAGGKTQVTLDDFEFGSVTGEVIPTAIPNIMITVGDHPPWDVNQDGRVSILDLIRVAQRFGETAAANSEIDINDDGIINIQDLILIAQHLGESTDAASPSMLTLDNIENLDPAVIQSWIALAQLEDEGSLAFREGIAYLQSLLALLVPEETALLPNYPNPFNPETWIPYQLSEPVEVTLRIYAVNGELVRTLDLGHKPAGIYQNRSRAVYWDGKNEVGESVASGIYFYTLTAGDFTATRKMLIRK